MYRKFSWALLFLTTTSFANFYEGRWDFHHQNKVYSFSQGAAFRGSPMLSVDEISKRFDLKFVSSENRKSFVLKRGGRQVTLRSDSSEIIGFWGRSSLSRAPQMVEGKLMVPLDFGDRALRPLLTGKAPMPLFPERLPFAVDLVIDPGHGGNDFGAIVRDQGQSYFEKDVVLLLAKDLKALLLKKGIKVALTREDDLFLALPERTAYVNRLNPKLFLSLHLNSSEKIGARGFELYVLSLNPKDRKDALVAVSKENMNIPDDVGDFVESTVAELRAQTNFESSLAWSKVIRGALEKVIPASSKQVVRPGPFYVLYGAAMPALLLELGYLNQRQDRSLVETGVQRRKFLEPLAEALAEGIKKGIVSP